MKILKQNWLIGVLRYVGWFVLILLGLINFPSGATILARKQIESGS